MTATNTFSDVLIGRALPAGAGVAPFDPGEPGDPNWHPLQQQIITSWLMSSGMSDTGTPVTPETAMQAAAVFACVNVIATSLATLPIRVIRRSDGAVVTDHPLNRVLNSEMNTEQTSSNGREALMVNVLLWGNAFAYVEKDETFQAVALWPLRAASTSPYRYPNGDLYYRTITGGAQYTLTPDQVFNILDVSYDGLVGLSRVRYGTNPIGLALAMEKFGAKFFRNGANAGGIVKLPPGMKPDAVNAFKDSWRRENSGPDNAFKTAMFTDGMDFIKTASDPRNSQMIDTRLFQVREVARLFRVPLHKIGDMGGATFSNIEQQNMEFTQDGLRPWATKIDQELERKLLLDREKGELCIRHDFDELLRGDTTARYAAYHSGILDGWLLRNEVRRKEGLPPIPGGDVALVPLNMGPSAPPTNPAIPPRPANPDKKEDEEETEEDDD